jgi:hypothetical protein
MVPLFRRLENPRGGVDRKSELDPPSKSTETAFEIIYHPTLVRLHKNTNGM